MLNKKFLVLILLFTFIIFLPILFLFVESFRAEGGGISLTPLKNLLLSPRQIHLMVNSLILASGTTVSALLIGVPLAFFIQRTDVPFRRFFYFAYLIPLLIPPYMQALIWTKFFGSVSVQTLDSLSTEFSYFSIYSFSGGIFVFTLAFFPFVTLITSSGLNSVSRSLEEVSLMSKGGFKTIRGVTLPLVTPHITSAAILVFVFTLVNFEVADILRLKVYPMEIFINFSAYYDVKAATILSLPLIITSLFLIWWQMWFMRGKSYVSFTLTKKQTTLFSLGKGRQFFLIFPASVFVVSVMIPLATLIKGAGPIENYLIAFSNSRDQLFYSIYVSALASFCMVGFSFAISYCLERSKGVIRDLLEFLTQTPFGIPSIVLGIGLIKVWNQPGIDWVYSTSMILIFGYVAGYSPFVIKIISTKIRQIDREFEEAGILGTGSSLLVFVRILIPLSLPGIVAGFLTGFVLSLSNLGTALLVVAPGRATIPIKIYNLLHYGAEDMVYALSLILIMIIAFSLLSLYPFYRLFRLRERV